MTNGETSDCLACKLATGRANLPGGRIFETPAWLVEHCVGPMNVGTLVVKPRRHCTHVWDLTDAEANELRATPEYQAQLREYELAAAALEEWERMQ